MDQLTPVIRNYAWGSHDELARLTGRPHPTAEPEAELWMGAHEGAPSGLERDGVATTLDQVVAADPAAVIGPDVADQFGGRLPFLLKVLAPVKALSIQAHPNATEAREAPAGTYIDDWPKPEAFVAVTPFEVFAGTRPFDEIASLATRLDVARLSELVGEAAAAETPAYDLLRRILDVPADEHSGLADEVVAAAQRLGSSDPDAATLAAVVRIAGQFPGDIGVVVLLTMAFQVVDPGKYVFVPAGVLHAYVHGVAVEILANSDNVVRAGLTPKQIDVPELLRIVDVDRPMVPETGTVEDGWTTFPADASYFRLRLATLGTAGLAVPGDGQPRILLALNGSARLTGAGELELASGESCFLAPGDQVQVAGDATVYLASPGLD
ncbi:mannose-6-phosphate isomerase, class I [Luteipulveratus mongoliensis]|uniref:mannose-6-phosphate isomerase n=1 Tax=Luteipulveratus mongoliensis TaxID=571913 RepID=A0A0K1JGG6_9MICO|nr:mannose-6-phosphate isomerase, class I [Luteipulveratus mongoliensis]AKU15695.1 hypothetical protein VV02_07255 [Luteipulveratus mongoliensis]